MPVSKWSQTAKQAILVDAVIDIDIYTDIPDSPDLVHSDTADKDRLLLWAGSALTRAWAK